MDADKAEPRPQAPSRALGAAPGLLKAWGSARNALHSATRAAPSAIGGGKAASSARDGATPPLPSAGPVPSGGPAGLNKRATFEDVVTMAVDREAQQRAAIAEAKAAQARVGTRRLLEAGAARVEGSDTRCM